MASDNILSAFVAVIQALLLAASVYVYASLIRQIRSRVTEPSPIVPSRLYSWPEAVIAGVIACYFLANVVLSLTSGHQVKTMRTLDMVVYSIFTIGMFVGLAAFLHLRRFDLGTLGGFSRIPFSRVIATGGLLLLAAYPLVIVAEIITQKLARGSLERQEIIEVFNASSTLEQRALIILLAVTIAPLTEEFFFRFFLYGVMKRYFGRAVGIFANALLFAAVHAHLPSFAPLFVLGVCLTIAYEWSGSILVSMTMHALFNALALTALAFPETFSQ